jgi:hypothetical protein
VFAVHVVAIAAREADAAGAVRVADHRVAMLDRGDVRPDILDPTGVFMAHDVGQEIAALIHDVLPDTFDDVQVGAAETGGPHLHDHIVRAHDGRGFDRLDLQLDVHRGVVFVKSGSFHVSALSSA